MTPSIYKAPVVGQLQAFYGALLMPQTKLTIKEQLLQIAEQLLEGISTDFLPVFHQINNYHPDFLGHPIEKLRHLEWTEQEAQQCIASEYGFMDWKEVEALNTDYDVAFEQAVQAIIHGNEAKLQQLLDRHPYLTKAKSPYGHRAALLHYTASNGVEMWRQQVPSNLPKITQILLENGADKKVTMKVYGGQFTTLELLQTSAHPKAAGLLDEMVRLLQQY